MSESSKCSLISNDLLQDQHYAVQQQPTGKVALTSSSVHQRGLPQHKTTLTQTYKNINANTVTSQPAVKNRTIVITTQPKRQWKTGLGDCCNDCSVCMCACCCGYFYSCSLALKMGEIGCVMCCPGGLPALRTHYRTTHHIEGTLMDDLCKSCFCHVCILCQMGNDMKAEGYPTICCC